MFLQRENYVLTAWKLCFHQVNTMYLRRENYVIENVYYIFRKKLSKFKNSCYICKYYQTIIQKFLNYEEKTNDFVAGGDGCDSAGTDSEEVYH